MPDGLKRYQTLDHNHLITISCYGRRPYLCTPEARDLFASPLNTSANIHPNRPAHTPT